MRNLFAAALAGFLLCSSILTASPPVAPEMVRLRQTVDTPFDFFAVPQGTAYNNWLELPDGHTIISPAPDQWYYAEWGTDNLLVPTLPVIYSPSSSYADHIPRHLHYDFTVDAPSYGKRINLNEPNDIIPNIRAHEVPILMVLVEFTDISFSLANRIGAWDEYLDKVSAFYYEQQGSSGRPDFAFVRAFEWYTEEGSTSDGIMRVSLPHSHPNIRSDLSDPAYSQLAQEIFSAADTYVSFEDYDHNGDGVVSSQELAVVFVLAGYDTSFGGTYGSPSPSVWAHTASAGEIEIDGVKVGDYTMMGERHALSSGSLSYSQHRATVGLLCHELGHLVFNLPDLHDLDGSSYGGGDWMLMGSGLWGRDFEYGDSPAHLCGFHKDETGLFTSSEITIEQDVELYPSSYLPYSNGIYKVWVDPYKVWEKFYIEYEAPRESMFHDVPDEGIMITHVDKRMTDNTVDQRRRLDVEDQRPSSFLRFDRGNSLDLYHLHQTFEDPHSSDNDDNPTGICVDFVESYLYPKIAHVVPRSVDGEKEGLTHFDINQTNKTYFGFGHPTIYTRNFYAGTPGTNRLEGFDIYCRGEEMYVDFYLFLNDTCCPLYSELGFTAHHGWNRFFISDPQPFHNSTDYNILMKIYMKGETEPLTCGLPDPTSNHHPGLVSGDGVTFLELDPSYGAMAQILLLGSSAPLWVELLALNATVEGEGANPIIEWQTASEIDNAGFHLYRAERVAGKWQVGERITSSLIPSEGSPAAGATYTFEDTPVYRSNEDRRAYYLQDVDMNGETELHGPVMLRHPRTKGSRVTDWMMYSQ